MISNLKNNRHFLPLFIAVLFNCFGFSHADNIAVVSAHGLLMTVGWIVFGSTGILLIRYYTHLGRIVYTIHIVFAILVLMTSIAAILLMLGYYFSWQWVPYNGKNNLAFAHSVIGMTAVGFALLQILSGFIHVRDKADRHWIARYLHRFGGIIAFILASWF